MPATQTDYSQIKINQDKAASLNKQAAGMESTAFTLPDTIMNAVRTDRQSRGVSKLATDVGNVMGQMVTDPNAIREGPDSLSAGGLVDPFSVNQLTSNARAQNLRTLGTAATQGQLNQGGIDEVIQAGANQLKARAATLLAQAQEAQSQADALQNEWNRQMQEQQFAADESYRQQQMALDWYNATNTGGTSGVSGATGVGLGGDTANLTIEQLNQALDNALVAGDAKTATMIRGAITSKLAMQKNLESDEKLADILGTIDTLKTKPKGILQSFTWKSKLNIATQRLAKYIEGSRLSDPDRAFYLAQMPNILEILVSPDLATAKIDGVVSALTGKSSSSTWE